MNSQIALISSCVLLTKHKRTKLISSHQYLFLDQPPHWPAETTARQQTALIFLTRRLLSHDKLTPAQTKSCCEQIDKNISNTSLYLIREINVKYDQMGLKSNHKHISQPCRLQSRFPWNAAFNAVPNSFIFYFLPDQRFYIVQNMCVCVYIKGVTGGTDQTSGGCSLC